jgi:hypothetical protein
LIPGEAKALRTWLDAASAFRQELAQRAQLSMEHKMRLLGAEDAFVGEPVNWHRDFVTGKVWPRRHFSRINYMSLGDPCDVKRCWDLSRAYHWVWMAQAYWLEGDARYADEVVRQWIAWLADNPPEIGVNWGNAMEVALRSVSWWWVLVLLDGASSLTDAFRARALGALVEHAEYIERRLEVGGDGLSSNHLVADYVGLSFCGILLGMHPRAQKWRGIGLKGLWHEVDRQVYPDGVDYEQSTEYHRLKLECFLYAALVARRSGYEVPPTAWGRMEKMLEYSMHLTRPDGLTDSIGDGDGGRVCWLTDRPAVDHRGLLAVGAVVFERGDFKFQAGEQAPPEVAWVLGLEGVERYEALHAHPPGERSRAFRHGGTYIMRSGWHSDASQVVIDAGYLGMGPKGFGSHGHGDTLSFTFFARGRSQLVDPGTYVYTSDSTWRDAFRRTCFHNGLTVDGRSVCAFDDGPFQWSSLCNPSVEIWCQGNHWVVFRGTHDGFQRIGGDIVHVRSIALHFRGPLLLVFDEVRGTGVHSIDTWFQFGPRVRVETQQVREGRWCGPNDAGALGLYVRGHELPQLSVHYGDEIAFLGWFSERYGRKEPAATVRLSTPNETLPYRALTVIGPRCLDANTLVARHDLSELTDELREALCAWHSLAN